MTMTSYDDFASYYDADVEHYTEDIMLYREMALRTGGPILDLMCGSGRVLFPLTYADYQVTGVDVSLVMLDKARERALAEGIAHNVTLVQGDICSIDLPSQHYALAFVALNSFMHLESTANQLAALTNIRCSLRPGGLFIIDVFNFNPTHLESEDNRMILERDYLLGGKHIYKFVTCESDIATQMSSITTFYDSVDDQGQVCRQVVRFGMRWLYRYELEHLLARTGFMVLSVYGSYDLDPYTSESERLIVLASVK
jgi:SAM-dependent methyltransferase